MSKKATNEPIHVIRTTRIEDNHRIWIVCDSQHRLDGRKDQSKRAVVNRFVALYGMPTKQINYDGVLRRSEMAMTIAEIQKQK